MADAKLAIEKIVDGGITCLRLTGTIDEAFEGKKLGAGVSGDVLLVDLGGIKKISSFGIREWVDFVTAAGKQVRSLILIECAPKVVDQLNMVANFTGGGRVYSFYAPFRCDYCDSDQRVLLTVDRDHETIKSMKLAERPCPGCKESMYFDDDGATFFSYLAAQPRLELEPNVAGFLAGKLSYAVERAAKLRVDKVIEGRVTYLRPVGDLDAAFPREKLADGLEGTVVVDCSAIAKVQPAGAAEWRSFVTAVTPLVDALYLVEVPPAMLDKVCNKTDLGTKAQVLSLTLPYSCASCKTTSAQRIDVAAHHKTLKFATAPELRCADCKTALACTAPEATVTVLAQLPAPTASAELRKQLEPLRAQAMAAVKRRSEPSIATPAPPAAPPSSRAIPILIATLGVVLIAIAVVAYTKLSGGEEPKVVTTQPGSATPRALTNRSAPQRPPWIGKLAVAEILDDEFPAATCDATACAGMSSLHASQSDAEDEALDTALAGLASTLATKVTDETWQRSMRAIYGDALAAKTAALAADPTSTTARRESREARRAVARALRAIAGEPATTPSARYWEEYTGSSGKRYVAFARVGLAEADRIVERAKRRATSLGATVVDVFPLIGWRHPAVERGAVIVDLDEGPLRAAGLPEHAIVLAIDDRPIVDAADFAHRLDDRVAALGKSGGSITLRVQTVDPTPRELTARIPPAKTTGNTRLPATGSGGINTWDRYDRDNPNR